MREKKPEKKKKKRMLYVRFWSCGMTKVSVSVLNDLLELSNTSINCWNNYFTPSKSDEVILAEWIKKYKAQDDRKELIIGLQNYLPFHVDFTC